MVQVTDEERELVFSYDASLPLGIESAVVDGVNGLAHERVRFRGAGGATVPAMITHHFDWSGPRPTLVVQHGLNGGKDDEPISLLRAAWAEQGFTCVTIDAPLHGERADGPLDLTALLGRPDDGMRFVQDTVIDLRRLMDYLSCRDDLVSDQVAYVGFSMSAFLGVQFVAIEPRVRAACFAMGGAGLFHALAGRAPAENRDVYERVAQLVDPLHYASRIAPRPVLQVNGTADEVVPAPLGYMLYGALGDPKQAIWYPGGHGQLPDETLVEMRRFLERSLSLDR